MKASREPVEQLRDLLRHFLLDLRHLCIDKIIQFRNVFDIIKMYLHTVIIFGKNFKSVYFLNSYSFMNKKRAE